MFVDDDDVRQHLSPRYATRRAMVVKAAEAYAPGRAATPMPSTRDAMYVDSRHQVV